MGVGMGVCVWFVATPPAVFVFSGEYYVHQGVVQSNSGCIHTLFRGEKKRNILKSRCFSRVVFKKKKNI